MKKKKSVLKRILGIFLLIVGILSVVAFIRFPLDVLRFGMPIFSPKFFLVMAFYAFLGYQSIKHGYYLLRYGESKEKVSANR